MATFRVLGIDPGSNHTGYGVLEPRGTSLVLVEAGCISTRAADPLPERLATIARGLREVVERTEPVHAAVETIFFAKNVRSAIVLGQARGVALLAIAEAGLELHEYAPAEVKRAVVGGGRAEKEQVAHMVRVLLGNQRVEAKRADVTDALAIAICHAHTWSARARLARAR